MVDRLKPSVTIKHFWFVGSIIDDVSNYYELISEVGQGAYGKVFVARKLDSDGLYALKFVQKSLLGDNRTSFKRELEILRLLSHPNISPILEIYET